MVSNTFAQQLTPQLSVNAGHRNSVVTLAFSNNGKYFLSGSTDNTAKLWEIESGREIRTFRYSSTINYVTFSPDDKKVFIGNDANGLYIYETETGKEVARANELGYRITNIQFINNGKQILTSQKYNCTLWDADKLTPIKSYSAGEENSWTAIAPDEKTFLCSRSRSLVTQYDIETGNSIKEYKMNNYPASYITFMPDNKSFLIWCDFKKNILTIDLNTGQELRNYADTIYKMSLSPDKKTIAYYKLARVKLADAQTGKLIKSFDSKLKFLSSIEISPDSKSLLAGDNSGQLRLWDIKSGNVLQTFSANVPGLNIVQFGMDSKSLLIAPTDGTLKQYDFSRGKTLNIVNWAKPMNREIPIQSRDGKRVLFASENHLVWYNLETKTPISTLKAEKNIFALALSADEKFAASYGANWIIIWDVQLGQKINEFQLPDDFQHFVLNLGFSADGKKINIVMRSFMEQRDIKTGNVLLKYTAQEDWDDIFISNDRKKVVMGVLNTAFSSNPNIELIDLEKYTLIKRIPQPKYDIFNVFGFTPDDKSIIFDAFKDMKIRVLDLATGKITNVFEGHSDRVWSASVSPNGKYAATGGLDGVAMIWDMKTSKQLVSLIGFTNSTDFIATTPDYYYTCTKSAVSKISWVIGLNLYTFEQFDLQYNRPDIVLKRLGMTDTLVTRSYRYAYQKRLKKFGFTESMFSSEWHVPVISISNKANLSINTSAQQVELSIKANDSKYNLDRINVWVNDVPVLGMNGLNLRNNNVTEYSTTVNVKLMSGTNRIKVSAINSKGTESLKDIKEIRCDAQATPQLFIATIGVSDYNDKDYILKYAAKDALDLSGLMESNRKLFSKVNTLRILDKEANRENIMRVKDFFQKSGTNDLVALFVAGHGLLDNQLDWYLATNDIDFLNPSGRGIKYEELESLIDGIPSYKRLILMDACHSGEVDKEETSVTQLSTSATSGTVNARGFKAVTTSNKSGIGLRNSFELMQQLFTDLDKGTGAVVISSAGGKEFALEGSEWSNGVFTFALMEGLKSGKADKNRDGSITTTELKDYVIEKVIELTQGQQNPTSRKENVEFDFRVW
jgi:WD40 repeat protein